MQNPHFSDNPNNDRLRMLQVAMEMVKDEPGFDQLTRSIADLHHERLGAALDTGPQEPEYDVMRSLIGRSQELPRLEPVTCHRHQLEYIGTWCPDCADEARTEKVIRELDLLLGMVEERKARAKRRMDRLAQKRVKASRWRRDLANGNRESLGMQILFWSVIVLGLLFAAFMFRLGFVQ